MPRGRKIRCARKSANGFPETISTTRASVLMPDWQYRHWLPGANPTGLAANAGMRSARVRAASLSCLEASPIPDVCVSRWRSVITAGRPSSVRRFPSSGTYLATGSSIDSLPSSCSISTAVAVIGLLMDAIQKMESVRMGRLPAGSAVPTAARCTTPCRVATSVTAPGTSRWLTNSVIRPAMAFNFAGSVWAKAAVESRRQANLRSLIANKFLMKAEPDTLRLQKRRCCLLESPFCSSR